MFRLDLPFRWVLVDLLWVSTETNLNKQGGLGLMQFMPWGSLKLGPMPTFNKQLTRKRTPDGNPSVGQARPFTDLRSVETLNTKP